ncbi:DUF2110 domain-containing protein [Halobacteriales archaeon SW_12_69_24]|nr:MAG: DUF2110 domain-containing protein [Halobacteriales archaeon SW_12_69_24]
MVVLATKVYVDGEARERALDGLETLVDDDLADLDVEFTLGLRDDGFPSVTVTGTDATVARNLLAAEWGSITPHREAGETHVGTLASWDDEGFVLDAGEDVRVPADELGLDRLFEWTRGTDRVNVNSATRAEVRATVNRAGHADDVVTVERLGVLEQSIVCREGTDGPGLLADVGPHLRSELLAVVP